MNYTDAWLCCKAERLKYWGALTRNYVKLHFVFTGPSQPTKDGNTAHKFKVADRTGSIDLTVWNDIGEAIKCGDIIRLTKG